MNVNVLNLSEVDLAYNAFVSTFVRLYNQYCPIRLVKHFSRKNDKPWLTNSLMNACHKKKLLYKKFIRSRTLTAEQNILTFLTFSPFLTISLCRAGQYLSHPVFSVLCHVFSQSVFLHVSLYVVPPSLSRSASAPSPRDL